MVVTVYEVYSGNQCACFLTEQEALQQELLSQVDFINLAAVDFSDFELALLMKQRYCWL